MMITREMMRNRNDTPHEAVSFVKSPPEIHPPGVLVGAIQRIMMPMGIAQMANLSQDL